MKQKRWRQLSIRSLIIVTAIIAIGIVTFGAMKSHEEATAVAFLKIEQHGGVFGYKLRGNSAYRNLMQHAGVSEGEKRGLRQEAWQRRRITGEEKGGGRERGRSSKGETMSCVPIVFGTVFSDRLVL